MAGPITSRPDDRIPHMVDLVRPDRHRAAEPTALTAVSVADVGA
jgi:hypothetical protein